MVNLMQKSIPGFVSLLVLFGVAANAGNQLTDPDETVVLQVDDGAIVIQLNPTFAPDTVAQFKRLVREGFYDGLPFYRVIDGFVAQGGDGSDMSEDENAEPAIKAEFELDWSDDLSFVTVQDPALFAPETGFVDGFPAARSLEERKVWLTHCPGSVGMARGDAPDSGSTDFYIVIGQAPRYLDRNITTFGRVIYGMDTVQRIRRGPPELGGMIAEKKDSTLIRSARILSDLPEDEQISITVPDTNSDEFRSMFEARRHRTSAWFIKTPPAVLDVCQVPNSGTRQQ